MADYIVAAGQTDTGTTLNAGDDQRVFGTADHTTINASALQQVYAGGTALSATVNNGGVQYGFASSNLNGTTVLYGGSEVVYGQAEHTTIGSGGTQTIYGSADDSHVGANGTMVLSQAYGDTTSQFTHIALEPSDSAVNGFTVGGGDLVVNAGTTLSGGYLNANNGIQLAPTVYYNASGAFAPIYGGKIDLNFLHYQGTATSVSFNQQSDILTVTASNTNYDIQLSGDYSKTTFSVGSSVGGNDYNLGHVVVSAQVPSSPLCFCRGTRLAAPGRMVAVEELEVGQDVLTTDNGPRRVAWIGSGRRLALGDHRPVIVRADAFGAGVPARDLRVTYGHSFLFDDVLVPIGELINGRTIVRDTAVGWVEYFHVELETHDILIAEGALAESYRDDGNRRAFPNSRGTAGLAREPCFPVLSSGAKVDTIFLRLAERAAKLARLAAA